MCAPHSPLSMCAPHPYDESAWALAAWGLRRLAGAEHIIPGGRSTRQPVLIRACVCRRAGPGSAGPPSVNLPAGPAPVVCSVCPPGSRIRVYLTLMPTWKPQEHTSREHAHLEASRELCWWHQHLTPNSVFSTQPWGQYGRREASCALTCNTLTCCPTGMARWCQAALSPSGLWCATLPPCPSPSSACQGCWGCQGCQILTPHA